MTKELIQARIQILEQSRDQARANVAAHEGALQEANYWLQQIDLPKEEIKE